MLLMTADIELDELGEALAGIEDERARDGSTGGAHALATGVKPRGNGQGRGGGAPGGRGGRGGGGHGKRNDIGHHYHQQQWASQLPIRDVLKTHSKLAAKAGALVSADVS